MNAEQQRKLEAIRAKRNGQLRATEEFQSIMALGYGNLTKEQQARAQIVNDNLFINYSTDIDALLAIIDQQQAVLDATQTYRDAIDRWMADAGETGLPRSCRNMPRWWTRWPRR